MFTLSVRSRHVPLTPLTLAWPPSLPSVPTSRATRVTSSAKAESWSTMALTVVPMRRNSPLTGWSSILSAIFCERSPSATATMTRATSVVGRTRSSTKALTDSSCVSHVPSGAGQRRALVHAAFAADDPADARELARRARVELGDLVERGTDLTHHAGPARREAHAEVAALEGFQRV
jgi:hypothetical protein